MSIILTLTKSSEYFDKKPNRKIKIVIFIHRWWIKPPMVDKSTDGGKNSKSDLSNSKPPMVDKSTDGGYFFQ